MAASDVMHDAHEGLVSDLSRAVQQVVADGTACDLLCERDRSVAQLCRVLEKILSFRLIDRSGLFSSRTTYWSFLRHLGKCLPDGAATVKAVASAIGVTTDRGRARAWVRLSLNDAALADNLQALLWNQDLVRRHYQPDALVRDEALVAEMIEMLRPLANVAFALALTDVDDDVWLRNSVTATPIASSTVSPSAASHASVISDAADAAAAAAGINTSVRPPALRIADAGSALTDALTSPGAAAAADVTGGHRHLLMTLNNSLQVLLDAERPAAASAWSTDDVRVRRFCAALEAVLSHRLTAPGALWAFLATQADARDAAASWKHVRSDAGRARALLSAALTHGSMASLLSALLADTASVERHFAPGAVLRDAASVEVLTVMLAHALPSVDLDLPVDDASLDDERVWKTASAPNSARSAPTPAAPAGIRRAASGTSRRSKVIEFDDDTGAGFDWDDDPLGLAAVDKPPATFMNGQQGNGVADAAASAAAQTAAAAAAAQQEERQRLSQRDRARATAAVTHNGVSAPIRDAAAATPAPDAAAAAGPGTRRRTPQFGRRITYRERVLFQPRVEG